MLSYARLKRISLTEKPYRGSTNRFPILSRNSSEKYFLVESENGETIFRVMYKYIYYRISILAEDVDELRKQGRHTYVDSEGNCFLWVKNPSEIGVVRSDNTFEFTAKNYELGARYFLSSMSNGYFFNDSRRGGMLFKGPNGICPIYHGARVHIDSMRPTKDITITGKAVDRKMSKKLMAGHEDFFATTETMCKAMNLESWVDLAKTIYLESNLEDMSPSDILVFARSIRDSSPLDAMILYAFGLDDEFKWKIKNPSSWSKHRAAIEVFDSVKTKLVRQIYKENEDIFKPVIYEIGKAYPPSIWGYTLMVDGVEVEQYGYGV